MNSRKTIPWTFSNCGGPSVHGLIGCPEHSSNIKKRFCICSSTPDKNYFIQFILAKHIYKNKLHLQDKNIVNSWEQHAISFCQLPEIIHYDQIKGQSLRKQFDHMIVAAKVRLETDGFETHPDLTPYDELMFQILEEMENLEHEKKLKKDKANRKYSSCMTFEKTILGDPITPENKRRKSITEEIENEDDDYFYDEEEVKESNIPISFEDKMIQVMENLKPDHGLDDRKLALEEKRFEFEKQKWEQQMADSRAETEMRNKIMMAMIEKLGK